MIQLLDIEDGVVKATIHCQMISWLKKVNDEFPENHLKIYAYLFYMTCPTEENPYFNLPESTKEDIIINDLEIDFSLDEDSITIALENMKLMYETPTVRAHRAIKTMLDNLSTYMETAKITAGRDGNITALTRVAKDFDGIRQSYKGVLKDLKAEQESQVRGGQDLAYDQQ